MIRNDATSAAPAHHDMTATLADDRESQALELANSLRAREAGKLRHGWPPLRKSLPTAALRSVEGIPPGRVP